VCEWCSEKKLINISGNLRVMIYWQLANRVFTTNSCTMEQFEGCSSFIYLYLWLNNLSAFHQKILISFDTFGEYWTTKIGVKWERVSFCATTWHKNNFPSNTLTKDLNWNTANTRIMTKYNKWIFMNTRKILHFS